MSDPGPDEGRGTAGGDSDVDADGDVDERTAVDALERLGLSNYEARVFVALQRLGAATAKEIHEAAGVPRSQVYGAADELVARGLLERQQSTPKRYRPVSLAAARERLAARIEREQDRAFDYLQAARRAGRPEEVREDVWSLHGPAAVTQRAVGLVDGASDRVVVAFAAPDLATPELRAAVRAAADRGVDVTVVSPDPAVEAAFGDAVAFFTPPEGRPTPHTGRMLLVDEDAVLVSVRAGGTDDETAIWSAGTALADVLVQTIHAGIESMRSVAEGRDAGADPDPGPDG